LRRGGSSFRADSAEEAAHRIPTLAFAWILSLAPAAHAAAIRDQPPQRDGGVITEYGKNADLPPDRWTCPAPQAKPCPAGKTCADETTPLQYAKELSCLVEWLWSVQRYSAAGGTAKKGADAADVARAKSRAADIARRLADWSGTIAAPPAR
jgi:hypothetical protein